MNKNIMMTTLKALAIIFIVVGHRCELSSLFPLYSFHIIVFIFSAGYFYKEIYEHQYGIFIIKKVKSLLIPYFAYNIFFMLITLILQKKGFSLGKVTLYSFFIEPFIDGQQYTLFLAGWFVPYLFIIQLSFVPIHWLLNKLKFPCVVNILIFFLLAYRGVYISHFTPLNNVFENKLRIMLIRILFGLFFYYLGFFYKKYLEKFNIINNWGLLIVLIIQVYIKATYPSLTYLLLDGNFGLNFYLPFVTSLTGLYIALYLAKIISSIVTENDIVNKIGENSFHIMSLHIMVFFTLNYIFIKLNHADRANLNNIWYTYNGAKNFFLYIILGILIPTLLATVVKALIQRKKLNNKI